MRQFDVFPNPIVRARRTLPFVILLQSDRATGGRERVVAPLALPSTMPERNDRLALNVEVDGRSLILLVPFITNLRASDLSNPTTNLGSEHDRIIAALRRVAAPRCRHSRNRSRGCMPQ